MSPPLAIAEARLSALHWRRFLFWGPRFLVSAPISCRSAASVRLIALSRLGPSEIAGAVQSSEAPRRGVVVHAGRVPGPPECRLTRPARGRRIDPNPLPGLGSEPSRIPHLRHPPSAAPSSGSSLEDAPRRAGHRQHKCAGASGDKFAEIFLAWIFKELRDTGSVTLAPSAHARASGHPVRKGLGPRLRGDERRHMSAPLQRPTRREA
jgi:hypothetical protein